MTRPLPHDAPLPTDDTLRRVVDDVHVVPLAMSLVQLTGDESILGEIQPFVAGPWDYLERIPADVKQRLRDRMAEALKGFFRGVKPKLAEPSQEQLQRMMRVAAGSEVTADYLPLIRERTGMGTERKPRPADPVATASNFRVVIVGAGLSGIGIAIKLRQASIAFELLEKNADVGGTWFENRYPGCAVDTPNHGYQYSFAPNNDWPHYYARRDANLDYLCRCADDYGIRPHITFNSQVVAATYDQNTRLWSVHYRSATGDMRFAVANVLITAVGQLNRPLIPDLRGLKSFRGPVVHTAEWPENLDLRGKTVALVGSAASAVQLACAVAPDVMQLTILQRSATWLTGRPDVHRHVSDEMKWALKHVPFYAQWLRFRIFWAFGDGYYPALQVDPAWDGGGRSVNAFSERVRQVMTRYIENELAGRDDLLRKALPDYQPFAKRLLADPGWYKMLRRDNVQLETRPIEAIERDGIRLNDDAFVAADVIVLATGFHGTRMLWPMHITGRNGRTIRDVWGDSDPRAYLGITVPGFPNMFVLYGPNTGMLHGGSYAFIAECQFTYIIDCIRQMIDGGYRAIDIRQDAFQRYNDSIDEKLKAMVWSDPKVRSWHKNTAGRVIANGPWRVLDYWQLTRHADLGEYEVER